MVKSVQIRIDRLGNFVTEVRNEIHEIQGSILLHATPLGCRWGREPPRDGLPPAQGERRLPAGLREPARRGVSVCSGFYSDSATRWATGQKLTTKYSKMCHIPLSRW